MENKFRMCSLTRIKVLIWAVWLISSTTEEIFFIFFPLICITEEFFFFFDPLQQKSSKKRYWCFQFMWAVWLVGVRSHNLLVGLFVVVLKLCSIFVVFWSRCFSRVSRGFWFVAAGWYCYMRDVGTNPLFFFWLNMRDASSCSLADGLL